MYPSRSPGPACRLLALSLSLAFAALSWAQAARQYELKIDAQPLAQALQAFSSQSGLQVMFFSEISKGLKSKPLAGSFTPEQALRELLQGTSLSFDFINDRTVTIRSARGQAAERKATSTSADAPRVHGLQLAQSQSATERKTAGQQEMSAAEAQNADGKGIPEILVKGKRSLNVDIERTEDAPQPYVVFGREEIQRSQAENLNEFLLSRLPMNAAGGGNARTPGSSSARSVINLRGLGENQTLILIDGRRVPGAGIQGQAFQPDINGIPLAAVERIEILPSTAGGIYGGSATGGVVNIILRRDFHGMETRANYLNTFDSDAGSLRIDLLGGLDLEGGRTRLLASATHSRANNLTVGDRDFTRHALALQLKNNPAAITGAGTPPLGATVNIISARVVAGVRQPLTLKSTFGGASLNSTITHIPLGYAGPGSDSGAALVRNAGTYNLQLPPGVMGSERGLMSAPSQESASLNVRREFGRRVEAFIDLSTLGSRGSSFSAGVPNSVLNMPVSNPFNPFNQPINVRFPTPGYAFESRTESTTLRANSGMIVRLPGDWTGELGYGWSRSRQYTRGTATALEFVTNSLLVSGQPGPNGRPALNALQEGNTYPIDFGPYLLHSPNAFYGPYDTVLTDATFRLSGPALRLPAGPLVLSALLERRAERMADGINTNPGNTRGSSVYVLFPHRSQDADSAYLEARAPLISPAQAVRGVHELELQASVRHDRYQTRSVFETVVLNSPDAPVPPQNYDTTRNRSTDHTVALRYAPVADIALRASFGTGFLPPSVQQIASFPQVFELPSAGTQFGLALDRRRGDTDVAVDQVFRWVDGGNPHLLPELSETWSAGVILTPRFAPALRISVDYTRIDKTDEIQYPSYQFLFDNEALFPGRIGRGSRLPDDPDDWAGTVAFLDTTLINIARSQVEAFDFQVDCTLDRRDRGTFHFYALATWQPHLTNQALPGSVPLDLVGYEGPLEWRGNIGLDWERGPVTLGWNMQYYDSYHVYSAAADSGSVALAIRNQGSATVRHQRYHDLIASYRFGRGSWLADTDISFGIQNVLDTSPPVLASATSSAGYSTYGDPRLRRYSVSLRRAF